MVWHWRVSTGQLELANRRPDPSVIYLHKGDQLSLRELASTERLAASSCRTDAALPIPRIGKPASVASRHN